MEEMKKIRLGKIAKDFNIAVSTITEFLQKKGYKEDFEINTKVSQDIYEVIEKEYSTEKKIKTQSEKFKLPEKKEKTKEIIKIEKEKKADIKIFGKIDLDEIDTRTKPTKKPKEKVIEPKDEVIEIPDEEPQHIEQATEEIIEEVAQITQEPNKVEELEEKSESVEQPLIEIEEKQPPQQTAQSLLEKKEETKDIKIYGKIDIDAIDTRLRPRKKTKKEKEEERRSKRPQKDIERYKPIENKKIPIKENVVKTNEVIIDKYKTEIPKITGPNIVGKMQIVNQPTQNNTARKNKRKRITKEQNAPKQEPKKDEKINDKNTKQKQTKKKVEINQEEVKKQLKQTFAQISSREKSKSSKFRRQKRDDVEQRKQEREEIQEKEKSILDITEFISVSELALIMDIPVNKVIESCMSIGLFVSINQRIDADTISMITEEFGYTVNFKAIENQEIKQEEDKEEDKTLRYPIVTVMGHVDHGKTSLLDYIRKANVIAGEAGGITQHIGAYNVKLENGKHITFLDTPGHEAFTAMRARGAQVTDIVIIVVAADDSVMPQTIEAINHAQAAGVPIVFAINKIDKENADAEKIKKQLAEQNCLIEEWGGKYQSQEISAKKGTNVKELLEKTLLEAEMLELKANPNRNATGVIVESSLDKGRGYIATVLVQNGTLKFGDFVLAGSSIGKIKALFNERNQKIKEAKPATPALILGLNSPPQAGEKFYVVNNEKEAKEIANKREQLVREQSFKTHKHLTLEEVSRRIKHGNFNEINIIIKADFDGSVEALADSIIKESAEHAQIKIIHKAVGEISESDILLASASNAIVIGFNVRPSVQARRLAEKEGIEIRFYSIIYDAINEIKDAVKGMIVKEKREQITATIEVKEVFKVSKVGTIAGCFVKSGKLNKKNKIRIIRDGVIVFTGQIESLKRFKDDAKEVMEGQDCGIGIENYNDIKTGDILETFEQVEIN